MSDEEHFSVGDLLYRVMLFAYPRRFRRAYGHQLTQIFRQHVRDAQRNATRVAVVGLWMTTVADLLHNVPLAWLAEYTRWWDVRRLPSHASRNRRDTRDPDRRSPASAVDSLLQDLHYATRLLVRRPGFSATAVCTLALGIGGSAAIFSVVHGVLLRPLPYTAPDRLVAVWQLDRSKRTTTSVSLPNFLDWNSDNRVFDGMAATSRWGTTLREGGDAELVSGAAVSHNLFDVLGVRPMLGRGFVPEEQGPGSPRVVVLSYGLWVRRFGSDSSVVDRTIALGGERYRVVGVAPPGFRLPMRRDAELWETVRADAASSCGRGCTAHYVIARLADGVSLDEADAALDALARRLEEIYPDDNAEVGVQLLPLHQQVVAGFQRSLFILLGAVGLVLAIACTNVANLLLTRGATRGVEVAVRGALGASRRRLVRQFLTESAAIGVVGGAVGLCLAYWSLSSLLWLVPTEIPRLDEVSLDLTAVVFAACLSLVASVVFGALPAAQLARVDVLRSLKEGRGGEGAGGGRAGYARNLLVIAETGLAFTLLVTAGLLIQSFVNIRSVDPGFDPANLLTARVGLPPERYNNVSARVGFFEDLMAGLEARQGIQAAGAIWIPPISTQDVRSGIEGAGKELVASARIVSEQYFRAAGTPLVRGRGFSGSDHSDAARVAIVSETMARLAWPDEDPLGKRITLGLQFPGDGEELPVREVVGVVADVKLKGLTDIDRAVVYLPYRQTPMSSMSVILRTTGDPMSEAWTLREVVRGVDRELVVTGARPMSEIVSESLAGPRFYTVLLTGFALVSIVLAAGGIYGVTAFAVSRRTREIGVRMALGADSAKVVWAVVGRGTTLALLGIGAGVGVSLVLTRLLSGLLFEVSATDPLIFSLLGLLLVLVAAVANYLPARRASKVDPMAALKYE